jgi:hypothetical protein
VGVASELETKAGPLPVWAWGGGLAVGILAFRHWSAAHAAANGAAQDASTTGDPTAGDQTDPGLIDGSTDPTATDPISTFLQSDPTNTAFPVGAVPSGVPAPVTNGQWSRLAADYLISKGDNPLTVETALYRFTHGQSLNAEQKAIIDLALTAFGTPPEGVIPVSSTPTAPTGTTVPAVPAAPKLTAQATADHRIAMSWTHSPGANVYLVFRNGKERKIVRGTSTHLRPLRRGSTWTVYVLPVGLRAGHPSNKVTVRIH